VATLVIVVFFAMQVLGIWMKQGTLKADLGTLKSDLDRIKGRNGGLPNERWISSTEEYIAKLKEQRKAIIEYYQQKDKAGMEKWFEGLSLGANGRPALGDFNSVYSTQKGRVEDLLKDAGIAIGKEDEKFGAPGRRDAAPQGGFPWETAQDELDMQTVQKRFWMLKRLALAIAKTKSPVTADQSAVKRFEEAVFLNPMAYDRSKMDMRAVQMLALPDNLGTRHEMSATIELEPGAISQFMENLLTPDKEMPLMLYIGNVCEATNATGAVMSQETPAIWIEPKTVLPEKAEEQVPEEDKQKWTPPVAEPQPVRLSIRVVFVDFEMSAPKEGDSDLKKSYFD
jgi:hypothetical protein